MAGAIDFPECEAWFEALSGASQAHKLGATDGQIYAVKFREKAEYGSLGLARELLAGLLAASLAAQVPEAKIVRLTQEYLDFEPRLCFSDGSRPAPGIAVGSRFAPPAESLPDDHAARLAVCPPSDVASVIVFNTWVACGDRSWNNYVFTVDGQSPRFASIDYAGAFVRAPDAALQISDAAEIQAVARSSWPDVDSALTRVETLGDADVEAAAQAIPEEFWSAAERDSVTLMLGSSRATIRAALERIRP